MCLRNVFSNMVDWYNRYILSKYCKSVISQGAGNKKKFVCGNATINKLTMFEALVKI